MKKTSQRLRLCFWLLLNLLALSLLLPGSAYADDCLTDPLNAADCMRTPGIRPVISIVISLGGTLATILVNVLSGTSTTVGQTASQTVTAVMPQPPAPPPVESPPAPQPTTPTAEQPKEILETTQDAILAGTKSPIFDLIKNLAGPASTVAGSLSEFFTFPDSPAVRDAIVKAMQAWRINPTKANVENLRRAISKTNDMRLGRTASRLDTISKAVDVVDAIGTGLDKAIERGYTGVDKALAVGAELGKKGLTWMLTKNPMVGLVDAALGGATQMIWGPEGRIDIGSTIDKGADAWDKTTQEWAGYTEGVVAQDAEIQMQDQFLHGLRRIRSQVDRGEITRAEGSARVRRLRDRMFGAGK